MGVAAIASAATAAVASTASTAARLPLLLRPLSTTAAASTRRAFPSPAFPAPAALRASPRSLLARAHPGAIAAVGAPRLFSAAAASASDSPPPPSTPPPPPSDGAAASGAAASPEAVAALQADVAARTSRVAQLREEWARARADLDTVRTRTQREVADAGVYSIAKLAKDLLDTVDVLHRALDSLPPGAVADKVDPAADPDRAALTSLHHGVAATRDALLAAFGRFEIVEVDPVGTPFDPNKHEALFVAPVPGKEPGSVLVCQKTGFYIRDRVLRPAQVGVVAG
ncbi:Mitochondrial matrix cochaperone [Cladochytrium tenue]|nr:Mitochondrial matrix cochaperone [Cladochytrium tenue]